MSAVRSEPAAWRLSFAAVMALPAVLVADVAWAALGGWQPGSRVEAAELGFLTLFFIAVVATALLPGGRRFYARRSPQILLLAASLLIAWLASELLLRTRLDPLITGPLNVRHARLTRVFHPQPGLMPGVSGESHYRTNSLGLRGPEPPQGAAFRVICLGASTTECAYLDDAKTWPHLLGGRLAAACPGRPVWVAAAAVSGTTSREHARFIETSPLMRRLDCLVILAGLNDLSAALAQSDDPPARKPRIWSRLALPRLVLRAWSAWTAERASQGEDATGSNYALRRGARRAAQLSPRAPDVSSAEYARRLREMIAGCKQRGVRPVFLTQPVLWSDHLSPQAERLLWLGKLSDGRYLAAGELRRLMDAYHRTLAEVCAKQGADCIDLASMSGQERFFYDDCHFNEAGAAEVARRVGDWFLGHGLPCEPARRLSSR